MDRGTLYADSKQDEIEARLREIYGAAQAELHDSFQEFTARKMAMDKIKRQQVEDGEISEADYKDWLMGQVFIGNQWKAKINHACKVVDEAKTRAMQIVNREQMDVFAENANYEAYSLEHDANISYGFGVYDADTVENLIREQPELLPRRVINKQTKERADAWNRKTISDSVTQGIIQGDDIGTIATRIATRTAHNNYKAVVRYARTAMTGAQNAGRMETLHRAQGMGINVKKKWLATLDSRTRDSHQYLDGQVQDIDKPFESLLGEIMFPGDLSAEDGDIWNCRCTLEYVYPDFADLEKNVQRYDQEEGTPIADMTYDEWKAANHPDWKKRKEPKGKPPKVEPPKNTTDYVQIIKDTIANHTGDWSTDDLISLGDNVSKEIERTGEETVRKLQAEFDAICRRIDEMESTGQDHGDEYWELLDKRYPLKSKIRQAKANAVMEALQKFRSFGGVTEKNLKEYADFSAYPYKAKEAKENTLKALNFYPSEWLEASRSFGKTLQPHWTTQRQYYGLGEIRISNRLQSNLHELGHRMEHVFPSILKAEKEFYERRTNGLPLEWLGRGYRKDEVSRRDSFVDAYMGKDYGGKAYELVSMGFESVLAPYPRYDLTKDPEMRNWILGMLVAL